jgi:hypothetical protein
MTLGFYTAYKSRKRQKARQASLVCPVSFPRARQSSTILRVLAMVGMGVEGVAGGDDEHKPG